MKIDIDDDEKLLICIWIIAALLSPCFGIVSLVVYLILRKF